MTGARRLIFVIVLLALFQSPSGQNANQLPRYIQLYQAAEKLYYNDNTSEEQDSIALATYQGVISLHSGMPDSILWDSYFKTGIYLQTASKFVEAIPFLKKAILLHTSVPAITEKLMYQPNLYLGNSYYSASMFDSAVYHYRKAEEIVAKYPGIDGSERLYNTIGAMSYESGDYLQSKIYFGKAIQVLSGREPGNKALMVNYKNNLASALRKLKQYDKAMEIFTALLDEKVNRDEILHNIGSIYLERGNDTMAIRYLLKVGYNDQNKFNDLGVAYSRVNKSDSAYFYFVKATDLNTQLNGSRKNVQYAITCKNMGDYFVAKKLPDSAIAKYHEAITQLVFDFNEADTRLNPSEFNGYFSVVELFEALSSKAKTFTLKYQDNYNKNDLVSSINAYYALYKLADYVIRNYTSEEAKLLLANRKYLSHTEPIDISLKLFEITGDSVFLRHAFRFDEKNKATILALQLQETRSKINAGLPVELLNREKFLKQEIVRLQLKLPEIKDSLQLAKANDLLLDRQIEIRELYKKFDSYPAYKELKFIDNTIDVAKLQSIVPRNYGVLSYHLGDTSLLAFYIAHNQFGYHQQKIDSTLTRDIRELHEIIQLTDRNTSTRVAQLSNQLYKQLIAPFEKNLERVAKLMIIPDDELSFLPFEILHRPQGKMLVNTHAVSYNYSCSLLDENKKKRGSQQVLAMAPFIKQLPSSVTEISGSDEKLTGSSATKEAFLKSAEDFPVIHLATHATANDSVPSKSFIDFYSSKLFTPEIAQLQLGSLDLIILSACETAKGQLVKGEGLMSLTRSFSYAGCRNIIASLWKADDASTGKISGQLHKYLGDGVPYSEALNRSLNDYVDSDVPARLKSPAYWAHLRLIGTFDEPPASYSYFIWIMVGAAVVLGAIIFLSMRRSVLS
ncbi:MAG: CHAT domain-containing protein [Chitinophagaceae bacterium]|nr:CHAT domain-containing protein [Chitinophagaceae bacterium]